MDPKDLACVARKMHNMSHLERDEMGKRGRAFYFSNLAPNIQVKHYEALLQDVLVERNGHRRRQ